MRERNRRAREYSRLCRTRRWCRRMWVSVLPDICASSAVRQLCRVGRRVVFVNLVPIQSDALYLYICSKDFQTVCNITGHVFARWVMVPQVQDDPPLTVILPNKPLSSGPHFRCAYISPAGKTRHIKAGRHLLNDTDESIFFHPHLNVVGLVFSLINSVGV